MEKDFLEILGADVKIHIEAESHELLGWFNHRQRRRNMGTLPSASQECSEDGCTWDRPHTIIEHCQQGSHCTAMDATCNAEKRHDDHPRHCCVCGEEVIK